MMLSTSNGKLVNPARAWIAMLDDGRRPGSQDGGMGSEGPDREQARRGGLLARNLRLVQTARTGIRSHRRGTVTRDGLLQGSRVPGDGHRGPLLGPRGADDQGLLWRS